MRLRLNTALPPDVYAKWEQARRKVEAESGRPLQEWEYVEALIDLARRGDTEVCSDAEIIPGMELLLRFAQHQLGVELKSAPLLRRFLERRAD